MVDVEYAICYSKSDNCINHFYFLGHRGWTLCEVFTLFDEFCGCYVGLDFAFECLDYMYL